MTFQKSIIEIGIKCQADSNNSITKIMEPYHKVYPLLIIYWFTMVKLS